jgi:hypothetical protein
LAREPHTPSEKIELFGSEAAIETNDSATEKRESKKQ